MTEAARKDGLKIVVGRIQSQERDIETQMADVMATINVRSKLELSSDEDAGAALSPRRSRKRRRVVRESAQVSCEYSILYLTI